MNTISTIIEVLMPILLFVYMASSYYDKKGIKKLKWENFVLKNKIDELQWFIDQNRSRIR